MKITFLAYNRLQANGYILESLTWDDFSNPAPFAGPPTWHAGDFNAGRSPSSTYYRFRYNSRPHLGTDTGRSTDFGKAIGAGAEGVIVKASNNMFSGAGRHVKAVHNVKGVPTYTYYLHLSRVSVKVGDRVSKGQKIGELGGSGFGSLRGYSPHLHTEIWQWIESPARNGSDGVHKDPGAIYNDKPSGKKGHPGGTMKSRVIAIQGRLNQLGFHTAIDGIWGPKTQAMLLAALAESGDTVVVAGIPAGGYVGPDGFRIGVEIPSP